MHILGAGRAAFLEFLRNLTPMVLLTSIAFVTWAQLDFSRWDPGNWKTTVIFGICLTTAALSFVANLWGFLDNALAFPLGLERAIRRLRLRGQCGRSPATCCRFPD